MVLVGLNKFIKRIEKCNNLYGQCGIRNKIIKSVSQKFSRYKNFLQNIFWIGAGYFTHNQNGVKFLTL